MSESSSLLSYSHGLDVATILIGAGLIWTGVKFYLQPLALADIFGFTSNSAEELIVFQSGTGRNIGAGLFVWIMTYLGERKSLGIFLVCWSWAGIADSKLLYEHPHGHRVGMHIRNVCILWVLGPLLIRSSMS